MQRIVDASMVLAADEVVSANIQSDELNRNAQKVSVAQSSLTVGRNVSKTLDGVFKDGRENLEKAFKALTSSAA